MNTELKKQIRTIVRKNGIASRDGIPAEERIELSKRIAWRIAESDEFQQAETVLIYKAVRGEVRLESLEELALEMGKKFCYPLCIEDHQMIALHPNGDESWNKGAYGIMEPIRALSEEIPPEEIDMVICPCTVFDESCNRMGMGAGYYDRFLPKCINASVVLVAFEAQKVDTVPVDSWDKPMNMAFTEDAIYTNK